MLKGSVFSPLSSHSLRGGNALKWSFWILFCEGIQMSMFNGGSKKSQFTIALQQDGHGFKFLGSFCMVFGCSVHAWSISRNSSFHQQSKSMIVRLFSLNCPSLWVCCPVLGPKPAGVRHQPSCDPEKTTRYKLWMDGWMLEMNLPFVLVKSLEGLSVSTLGKESICIYWFFFLLCGISATTTTRDP